jgi:hypothetical protein
MGKRNRKRRGPGKPRSTLPPNARSSELKLIRANEHLEDVRDPVERWHKACLNTLREEPDPNEAGYYCAWIDAPEIDAQRLSLSVGDCLQCFRSALDHLAFELAAAGTSPMTDEVEKDSEFPILSDVDRHGNFGKGPGKWRDSGASKVRGMDPAAQTIIEGLQPYKRGQAYETDTLWRLGQVNNIDKHRALHVATRVMTGATLPVNGPNLPKSDWSTNVAAIGRADMQPFILEIGGGFAAKGRTRVARWPMLPIDPSKKMHMNFKPVLGVAFAVGTPLVSDQPVLAVLDEIRDHIMGAVVPPLEPFL